jgi:hypothetical protein
VTCWVNAMLLRLRSCSRSLLLVRSIHINKSKSSCGVRLGSLDYVPHTVQFRTYKEKWYMARSDHEIRATWHIVSLWPKLIEPRTKYGVRGVTCRFSR